MIRILGDHDVQRRPADEAQQETARIGRIPRIALDRLALLDPYKSLASYVSGAAARTLERARDAWLRCPDA